MRQNSERKSFIISVVIAVIGVVIIFVPTILGMEGMNGGFAVSTVGFLVVIVGIIAAIIYAGRAKMLDAMFGGTNLLVHWTYSQDEWQRYTKKELEEERSGKKSLFFVTSGIALFIGAVFFIIDPEDGKYVFFAMLGLIAIIALVAYLTTMLNYRRNKEYLGEAYISKDGVYLNRVLHTWKGLGAQLDSVIYEQESQSLLFTYSTPDRIGINHYTLRMPVPRGQEDTAPWIVAKFSSVGGEQK